MKCKTFFTVVILFAVSAYTFGQDNAAGIDKAKTKTDRQRFYNYKFTRKALAWQYEKMAEAQKNVDIDLLLSLTHPAFRSYNTNGDVFDYDKLRYYWEGGLKKVVETIWLKNDIRQYKLNGDTAVVLVHQQWKRKQWMLDRLREVQTEAFQRETWLHTVAGWKRWKVDDVHNQQFYVDGKRVDPTKPYNPDEPAFEPSK